jgi:hypothetical protein
VRQREIVPLDGPQFTTITEGVVAHSSSRARMLINHAGGETGR